MMCDLDDSCLCGSEELEEALAALSELDKLSNKERRYRAYREAPRLLQYPGRQKLPPCVEEAVKNAFRRTMESM